MKTTLSTILATLMLMSAPAMAQTLSTMLPTLTWPEDMVTTSTKGCTPEAGQTVCVLPK